MDMSAFVKQPQVRVGDGSEGGHWYDPGPPVRCCYEILGKNGKWRPPTIRDARQNGWVPGVTTITRQAAAPGLERWKVRQGIMAALTHPKAQEIHDADELLKVLEEDSKAEARAAAERGTQIHKAIETFYATGDVDPDYAEYITGVRGVLHQLTGYDEPGLWKTEVACTHPFGVGTRIDLYSEELEMVCDFKGKEFDRTTRIKAYPEQGMQLAVGKEMLRMPKGRAVNLFISRNNPGLVQPYEWEQSEHAKLWSSFCWLLGYWQTANNMPLLVSREAA